MVYVEGSWYRLVRSRHIVTIVDGLSQGEAASEYHLRSHRERRIENGGVVNGGSIVIVGVG